MDKNEFKTIIEEFVSDNFEVIGGTEDSYIEPGDFRGSYDKAIDALLRKLGLWKLIYKG